MENDRKEDRFEELGKRMKNGERRRGSESICHKDPIFLLNTAVLILKVHNMCTILY